VVRSGILTKREMICLKYRWEFLRRNKDYQNDYGHIILKLNGMDFFKNSYPEALRQKVFEILLKWDLLSPISPRLSFNELLESDRKLKSIYIDSLAVNEFAIDCTESPDSLNQKDLYMKGSMLKMYVDMRFPKEKILDEFELLVDRWQKPLKKMIKKLPRATPEKRLQLNQYEKYLKVYDHYKKGISMAKLAKKFYPGYVESSGKDYAERKVLRDLNGCLRLIHGGYKQIR